jgi:hypothetical protein
MCIRDRIQPLALKRLRSEELQFEIHNTEAEKGCRLGSGDPGTIRKYCQLRAREKEVNKMNILVIDDKREEREKAKAAVEEAGHKAIVLSDASEQYSENSIWKLIEGVDGVITDLYFNPRCSNSEVERYYDSNPPPMGLVVALQAVHVGKQVVICTCGNHHGTELSFVFDAYKPESRAFGWEERKDWAQAVKLLEERIAR